MKNPDKTFKSNFFDDIIAGAGAGANCPSSPEIFPVFEQEPPKIHEIMPENLKTEENDEGDFP